jgi:hypothetical protein
MANKQFDVVVIGGGPGGYIAAIRAAQLGFNVACIDEWKNGKGGPAPGGTCTNVGCIPSKALLQSSEHFEQAGHHFADHGIKVEGLGLDIDKMLARKDQVVKQNNDGILYLFKKNKISFFHGRGSFVKTDAAGYEIKVAGAAEESISGKHIIVATGSNARALPGTPFDEENIRAAHRRCAEEAGPDRFGCHRPRDGFGVAPPRRGSHGARSTADVPGRCGRADRQGSQEGLRQAEAQDRARREGRRDQVVEEGRERCLDQRQGRSPDAGSRQADRVDRPRAQHHRPECRSRGPEARRARRHQRR